MAIDMAEQLDEMTYHLLAGARDRSEARQRVAVVAHWAHEQAQRLAAGRPPRLDHEQLVAEALAPHQAGRPAA